MTEFNRDVIEMQIAKRNAEANSKFKENIRGLFDDGHMFLCDSIKEINEKYDYLDRGWAINKS